MNPFKKLTDDNPFRGTIEPINTFNNNNIQNISNSRMNPSPLLTVKSPITEEQKKRHSSLYTLSPIDNDQNSDNDNDKFVGNFSKAHPSIYSPQTITPKPMSPAEIYNKKILLNKQLTESPVSYHKLSFLSNMDLSRTSTSSASNNSPSIFKTEKKNAYGTSRQGNSWEEYVENNEGMVSPKYNLDEYYTNDNSYFDSGSESDNSDLPDFY
jgi:hypothetical protein